MGSHNGGALSSLSKPTDCREHLAAGSFPRPGFAIFIQAIT